MDYRDDTWSCDRYEVIGESVIDTAPDKVTGPPQNRFDGFTSGELLHIAAGLSHSMCARLDKAQEARDSGNTIMASVHDDVFQEAFTLRNELRHSRQYHSVLAL